MLGKQMKEMTAVKLRLILIIGLALMIAFSAFGFWFIRNQLSSFATQVASDNLAASSSGNDISRLQDLEKQLELDKVAVTRAKSIVADSKFYQYQNQIITDMTSYAKASGVTINSFAFDDASGTSGQAAPAPAAPAPAAPAGLKAINTTITLKNPVKYSSVMKFIHYIEVNLTKMQLTGVSLVKATATTDEVTVNPLTVEVYVK